MRRYSVCEELASTSLAWCVAPALDERKFKSITGFSPRVRSHQELCLSASPEIQDGCSKLKLRHTREASHVMRKCSSTWKSSSRSCPYPRKRRIFWTSLATWSTVSPGNRLTKTSRRSKRRTLLPSPTLSCSNTCVCTCLSTTDCSRKTGSSYSTCSINWSSKTNYLKTDL